MIQSTGCIGTGASTCYLDQLSYSLFPNLSFASLDDFLTMYIPVRRVRIPRRAVQHARTPCCTALRRYHDDTTFGHRVPKKYELPDCT